MSLSPMLPRFKEIFTVVAPCIQSPPPPECLLKHKSWNSSVKCNEEKYLSQSFRFGTKIALHVKSFNIHTMVYLATSFSTYQRRIGPVPQTFWNRFQSSVMLLLARAIFLSYISPSFLYFSFLVRISPSSQHLNAGWNWNSCLGWP